MATFTITIEDVDAGTGKPLADQAAERGEIMIGALCVAMRAEPPIQDRDEEISPAQAFGLHLARLAHIQLALMGTAPISAEQANPVEAKVLNEMLDRITRRQSFGRN